MIARCRTKLQAEAPEVRARVTLVPADMTSFDLRRRFAHIYCPFGSFHHLRTVDEQLACLQRCHEHLSTDGRLVLDLINPDPAPAEMPAGTPAGSPTEESATAATGGEMNAGAVGWTEGRRIRSWASVVGANRLLQINDIEVTYEILEVDGASRQVSETFPMRFLFRYELEHLLARSGFRVVELYGDYDRTAFADESLGMIAVAEPIGR